MTSLALPLQQGERSAPRGGLQLGRMLVHPLYDYLLIGGGLSLLATVYLRFGGLVSAPAVVSSYAVFEGYLPMLLLLCNFAHVAASSVRLYTKAGDYRGRRFLTLSLPLATIATLTLSIAFAAGLGRHVYALYVTWLPFHYAAQAYGLALLYCYRSGCKVDDRDRLLLRVACLLPFAFVLVGGRGSGLEWLAPAAWLEHAGAAAARDAAAAAFYPLSFAAALAWPLLLMARGRRLPLISALIVLSNAVWWTVLSFINAFVLATVFHAVQYLAIVVVFHVREKTAQPGSRGPLFTALSFYAVSVALAYLLFNVWPLAYVWMGFGLAESVLLSIGVLSLYHFLVDAYIWRLRKDANYNVVAQGAASAAP